ncbi:extracellular solute-binding protein [Streptococcus equi subsp. equi]|nr:extracellular solute-binding protein [Streptococcus equi subsp. equi]
MTIKRYLGLAGLAVLSVGMLAACGTKEKSASSTKDTPKEVIFATVGTTAPSHLKRKDN